MKSIDILIALHDHARANGDARVEAVVNRIAQEVRVMARLSEPMTDEVDALIDEIGQMELRCEDKLTGGSASDAPTSRASTSQKQNSRINAMERLDRIDTHLRRHLNRPAIGHYLTVAGVRGDVVDMNADGQNTCKICNCPLVEDANELLKNGESHRNVSAWLKKFGVDASRMSVYRHAAHTPQLQKMVS